MGESCCNEIVISKLNYLYYYNQTQGPTLSTVDSDKKNTPAACVTKTQCHQQTQTKNAACHAVTQTDTPAVLEPIITKELSDFAEHNNENFDTHTTHTHSSEHSVAATSYQQPKIQPLLKQSDDAISLPSNFSGFTNFESIKYRWMQ